MAIFERYIGVDYSGAGLPTSRRSGLRVFLGTPATVPAQVRPNAQGWNWTRRELAAWLDVELRRTIPTIVGIDHGFSFPATYWSQHKLVTWDDFLDDFVHHWPTADRDVESLRAGNPRSGQASDLRLCEQWTAAAKSVFLFDVQGAVAMSTHAGLPWLRALRRAQIGVHFWPFDGWAVPSGATVVAEIYPSLFRRRFPRMPGDGPDEHDARSICAWLRERDQSGFLTSYFEPRLSGADRQAALLEGWILGVM